MPPPPLQSPVATAHRRISDEARGRIMTDPHASSWIISELKLRKRNFNLEQSTVSVNDSNKCLSRVKTYMWRTSGAMSKKSEHTVVELRTSRWKRLTKHTENDTTMSPKTIPQSLCCQSNHCCYVDLFIKSDNAKIEETETNSVALLWGGGVIC